MPAQQLPPPGGNSLGRHAWIDARNGVSGDMLLAALIDVGASESVVVAAIEAVLPGTVRLDFSEVLRAGVRAARVSVEKLADDAPHRDWATIRELLRGADLPEPVRSGALATFAALAAAEARAHRVAVDSVHFHEVGAWDSIADVVGVCAAVHDLGLAAIECGPVGLGSGSVSSAHGELPVPGPAVLELAAGWPVLAGGAGELATPTGMALVTTLATPQESMPAWVLAGVGVGAGSRDDPGRPNVVRVLIGHPDPPADSQLEQAVLVAANVDDLDPRLWPGVIEELMTLGAQDVWLTPILMKKGRPAHTLTVMCTAELVGAIRDRLFNLVPTLGVREHPVGKHALERDWVTLTVAGQSVRIKLGLAGGRIVTATPEFADVAAAALVTGRAERDMLMAANAAADAAGLRPGADYSP